MHDIDTANPNPIRRALLVGPMAAGGISGLGSAALAASAPERATSKSIARLPIDDPAFNVKILGRLQGDLSGKPVFNYVAGQVFGLVPGDGPAIADYGRMLYLVEGGGVRISRQRADGAVEERSRGWMFYQDPQTGSYLDEFENPYTGKKIKVPTFRGGISGSVMTVKGPEYSASFPMESTVLDRPLQLNWRFIDDQVWISRHAFTRWTERSTGFHKTEMTLDCWACRLADVANEKLTMIPSRYSWTSQTEWQSWLKMRGMPGAMLWRNEGIILKSLDELPQSFVERSNLKLPGALSEPLTWT